MYITAGCLAILCFGSQIFSGMFGITDMSVDRLKTVMFAFFIYTILFNSFNTRSENVNIFEHISKNKKFIIIIGTLFIAQTLIIQFGGQIFGTTALTTPEFLFAFIAGMLVIPIDMIRKTVIKIKNK